MIQIICDRMKALQSFSKRNWIFVMLGFCFFFLWWNSWFVSSIQRLVYCAIKVQRIVHILLTVSLKKTQFIFFCNFTLEMAQNKNETSTNLSVQNVATLNGHSRVSRVKKKLPLPTKKRNMKFCKLFFIGLNLFCTDLKWST